MSAASNQTRLTRLVARQVSELMLARTARWRALTPFKLVSGMVFNVVLGGSIGHRSYRDAASGRWIGIEDAATLGRPVSASAVAQSMGLPLTTVRRHATALVDGGLLLRRATGFSVAADFFAIDGFARAQAQDADDLARTLSALADAGYAPALTVMNADFTVLPPGVVARLLHAFTLRVLETFTDLYQDVTAGTIMSAIVAANIRHVTNDAALTLRYADDDAPPADAMRKPISLRALSGAVGLPFETVRRQVNALIAQDFVVADDAGVIVPTRVLLMARHLDNNRRILSYFDQLTSTLVSLSSDRRA